MGIVYAGRILCNEVSMRKNMVNFYKDEKSGCLITRYSFLRYIRGQYIPVDTYLYICYY